MTDTELKIPDLSIMATISRAELLAIVESLGLDPSKTERITMDSRAIIIHEWEGPRRIGVTDSWDVPE